MAYRDPKTGTLYPSKSWMLAHKQNLPEVQKAYGGSSTIPSVPVAPNNPAQNFHTVQRGETLSGIASQYGTNWQNIWKANPTIKNPNLIFPGQRLKIPVGGKSVYGGGGVGNARSNGNAGGSSSEAGNAGNMGNIENMRETGNVGGGSDKYKEFLLQQITQQNKYLQDYINTLKNQPSPLDIYKQFSEQLGIPGYQQQLAGIQKQVLDVEGLLDKLESDIKQRTTPYIVTEAQRRRLLASEGKPLRKQLANLMRAEARAKSGYSELRRQLADMLKFQGQEESRKEKLALLPLQYGYKNLPYYKEAFTYESPSEKAKRELAQKMGIEETLKTGGLGRYYVKPTRKTEPEVYRLWKLTGSKMSFGDWYKNVYKSKASSTVDKAKIKNDAIAKLQEYAGSDGYVSPDTYKKMKEVWRKRGYNITVGDFDKLFGSTFANPTHLQDYGLTTKKSGSTTDWGVAKKGG